MGIAPGAPWCFHGDLRAQRWLQNFCPGERQGHSPLEVVRHQACLEARSAETLHFKKKKNLKVLLFTCCIGLANIPLKQTVVVFIRRGWMCRGHHGSGG